MFLGKTPPRSCDTFAVLPPGTRGNCVVFGKNSDRPSSEVQEVIYCPAADHPAHSKVRCTYIEIEQAPRTHAVILSKPSWMWGAEMGANEHGVCIGNEAVWTVLNDASDSLEKLLGMDLLRLALERSKSASEAVKVIVKLIEEYGMGGNCSDTLSDFTYHNSFLVADPCEVWILECAGEIWAAERVQQGVRNISNELSIETRMDLKCDNLEQFASGRGLWNQDAGPLNFKHVFEGDDVSHRYSCGKRLLTEYSSKGQFCETDMFKVLRDKPSGICMSRGSFVSTGSQVSVLRKPESGLPSVHWFTATPDPSVSVFKPFIFTDGVIFPEEVISPVAESGKTLSQLRGFDRRHALYKKHEDVFSGRAAPTFGIDMKNLESKFVDCVRDISRNSETDGVIKTLFNDAVKEECKICTV